MSYEQMQNNQVYLSGQIASAPEFSHEIMGEKFYDTTVSVERLSGQSDVIPITVSDRLMEGQNFEIGNLIGLIGQFRSYNKIVDGKSKLVLRVFVRELCECDENAPNVIELEGYVCKPPVYRTTPFKREIADLLIAVNRAYNKSDYIPQLRGEETHAMRRLSMWEIKYTLSGAFSRVYIKSRLTTALSKKEWRMRCPSPNSKQSKTV